MAKKGNRVQVILECTEHKAIRKTRNFSLYNNQKQEEQLQTEWRLKNLIRF